jgi:hypothetical protein
MDGQSAIQFPLADGDAGVLCDSLFQGALGLETPSDPILCLKASRLYTAPESCGLQVCHNMAGFTPDAHIMWSSMKEMSSFQRCLLDIFHAYEQKSGVDAGSLKVFVDDTSSTELLLWH